MEQEDFRQTGSARSENPGVPALPQQDSFRVFGEGSGAGVQHFGEPEEPPRDSEIRSLGIQTICRENLLKKDEGLTWLPRKQRVWIGIPRTLSQA